MSKTISVIFSIVIFWLLFVIFIPFNTSASVLATTGEDALIALNESYLIMAEMQNSNFSVNYINDTIIQAKMIFEQAHYAEILRGNVNASEKDKLEANVALRLVDWKNISYGSVLFYTDIVKQRKDLAYLIADRFALAYSNLQGLSNNTSMLLEKAKIAFFEERYNDTQTLLDQFLITSEQEMARASTFAGLKNGLLNFFQRYWPYIILVLLVLFIFVYHLIRTSRINGLKKRIGKMKVEKEVLLGLMKRAQEERFKKNSISGLVYNIRMKKYQEKLEEIKQDLPVLQSKFDKML